MKKTVLMTGDVVEVLNLSSDQLNDISSQSCARIEQVVELAKGIIGMRYKVVVSKDYKGNPAYTLDGWNHGGHFRGDIKVGQVVLVNRSIKNHIKALWKNPAVTGSSMGVILAIIFTFLLSKC